MSILQDFTDAVVKKTCIMEGITTGYPIGDDRYRCDYMSEESWKDFLAAMPPRYVQQYMAGDGGELKPSGKRPPKMASLISSSRMIYTLSKDIPDNHSPSFCFEEKRDTVVGHEANLDGYYCRGDKVFYVEAKCREPYSHSLVQQISQNYSSVYKWLRKQKQSAFNCVMEDKENGMMDVVFLLKGKTVQHFDIKQMICHLLGIAAYHLRQEEEPKDIHFLYLLYDPTDLSLPEKSAGRILDIYAQTCIAAKGYKFENIFGHIIDYLTTEHGLPSKHAETLKAGFSFSLCSQNDYNSYFKI